MAQLQDRREPQRLLHLRDGTLAATSCIVLCGPRIYRTELLTHVHVQHQECHLFHFQILPVWP